MQNGVGKGKIEDIKTLCEPIQHDILRRFKSTVHIVKLPICRKMEDKTGREPGRQCCSSEGEAQSTL